MCKSTPISYSEKHFSIFFYYSTILSYILAGIEKHYLRLRLIFKALKLLSINELLFTED